MKNIKEETEKEKFEKEKMVILKYFAGAVGLDVFKKAIDNEEKNENMCPLQEYCGVHSAKTKDRKFPNFFKQPCWEMSHYCICPVKSNGEECDKCTRKKKNIPLC